MACEPDNSTCELFHSKPLLLTFCKTILSDVNAQKEQPESKGDNEKGIILDVYGQKCSKLIDKLTALDNETLSFVMVSDILQRIAQLLLDVTYIEECCLINHDFLLQHTYQRVCNIIEKLSSLESLAYEAAPGHKCSDILSASVIECIHWRKGALLYMYCHTLYNRLTKDELPSHFVQCLQDGSKHLIDMLSTRGTPQWLADPTSETSAKAASATDETDVLLAQGIYSDTHLLALMYLGEMCFWYAEVASQQGGQDNMSETEECHQVEGKCLPTDSRDKTLPAMSGEGHPVKDSGETASSNAIQDTDLKQSSSVEPDMNTTDAPQQSPEGITESQPSRKDIVGVCNTLLIKGTSLNMLMAGQLCLKNYVQAAKGPMCAGGWNTDRAEEILQYFEKLSI